MLAGLANPTAAQQVSAWAGNAAANVGNAFGQSAMNTAAARQQGLSNIGSSAIDLARGAWNWYNQPYIASGDLSSLSGTMNTGLGYMDTAGYTAGGEGTEFASLW